MKTIYHLIILICASSFFSFGQQKAHIPSHPDLDLAYQYFQEQAYEKVIDKLQELSKTSKAPQVYKLLFESYLELKEYRKAERLSRDWSKRIPPRKAQYEVDYIFLQLLQEDEDKAVDKLDEILESIDRSPGQAYAYGKALSDRGYPKRSLAVYQRAISSNPQMNFDYQMAMLYGELEDIPQMYLMYLQMVERTPGYLPTVKILISRSIDPDVKDDPNLAMLKQEIVKKIQAGGPKRLKELLIHIFSQEENFNGAFTQLKALDRQGQLAGGEINNLARIAFNSKDFRLSTRIYEYQFKKGKEDPYYQTSVIGWLASRQKEQQSSMADLGEWQNLVSDYEKYSLEFKGDPYQAELLLPMAAIYAYKLNEIDTAESLLKFMFDKAWLGKNDKALAQIAYADLLLFTGRRWDAIIYYRRAEKALDQSVIGQEAKFKRAKAAYYVGDFQWAQGIFSVLKESTSKLIANDAMQYSLLITDNMALDSTTEVLEAYARADLFYFREMYDSALALLEILELGYAEHPIADESLFLRATIKAKQGDYKEAVVLWQRVVDEYGKDILADDALFEMGQVYELQLYNKEAAMQAYQKLFTEHVDSFYASTVRKSYRRLRGDLIN